MPAFLKINVLVTIMQDRGIIEVYNRWGVTCTVADVFGPENAGLLKCLAKSQQPACSMMQSPLANREDAHR